VLLHHNRDTYVAGTAITEQNIIKGEIYMSKHIIVVGAGLAGLTAGIYARRSGFDVTILEQHSIPGGMSTSWKRNGYLFEGGIHWMTGSSPETEAYQLWKDVGALSGDVPVLLRDPFHSLEWEGQTLNIYRDVEKTAKHLSAISPEDAPLLRRMAKDVKAGTRLAMPVFDVKGVKAKEPRHMSLGFLFKMLPVIPVMRRTGKISCEDWIMRFSHPGIRQLFRFIPEKSPASNLLFTLSSLHMGDGGYPEGGSLPMTQRMAKTFTDLGGKLLFNTQVQSVNVQNGKAAGVSLSTGTMDADAVIVTLETLAALDRLFDAPPQDAWLKEVCELKHKSAVCTFISIGVRAQLPDAMMYEWKTETPITYAGQTVSYICINSSRDYAPEGGSALTMIFSGDTYDYWERAKEEGRYETEKQALADQVVRALCAKYPQCEGNIEVVDVATPLTYERYTGAYHGAWMSEVEVGDKMKVYPGTCEDINSLYFAGHRLIPPGGMPSAVASGRQAAQLVCRQFDVVFQN
jgi:phytoene dehydrogenase-like protein